jgi:DNA polymerase III sliding clamp (beta) subunit (PCNA family)
LVKENNYNARLAFFEDKMELKSEEGPLGQGKMDVDAVHQGESLEIALNAQFLLEAMNHLKVEKIKFTLNDSLSPVKVVPADSLDQDYIHIIMPLKV